MTLNDFKDSQQDPDFIHFQNATPTSRILTEDVICLLEERLMVNIARRKIGEIVVRKEIETQVLQVQVPVRHEKLIVEQVSPEYKRLAEVDLGQTTVFDGAILSHRDYVNADTINNTLISSDRENFASIDPSHSTQPTVYGEIDSPKAASALLQEIANMSSQDCETVRIEIVLKGKEYQDIYQALFERYG